LSKNEEKLLKIFSEYIECESLKDNLNCKFLELYCVNKKFFQINTKKRKIYLLEIKGFLCVKDIYMIIDFLDELYMKYLDKNKNINVNELNEYLFKKNKITDDELVKQILQMRIVDFIKKFSILLE